MDKKVFAKYKYFYSFKIAFVGKYDRNQDEFIPNANKGVWSSGMILALGEMSQSSNSRKRQIQDDDDDNEGLFGSPADAGRHASSSPQEQLPPSSPAMPFGDGEDDEEEEIRDDMDDLEDAEERIEDEEGEDLFGDNMMRDYRKKDSEDRYEALDIDDETQQDELSIGDRRRVDDVLNERDRVMGKDSAFLLDENDDEVERDQYGLPVQRRRRRRTAYDEDDMMSDFEDIDPLNEALSLESLADIKAPSVLEWIVKPAVSKAIATQFKNFLLEFNSNGHSIYGHRIRELGLNNSNSLDVNFKHLMESKAILAMFLALSPEEMLKIFDVVAMEATELHYPDYSQIHSEIHVRITDYPNILNLRDLRESNLNKLVRVTGVVTRRTGVFPQLKYVKFDCNKCNTVLGPYIQDSHKELKISYCPNCKSKATFRLNTEKTVYRNFQQLTIQEQASNVLAGRLPRSKNVIVTGDLTDKATPGEMIDITGIYQNCYDGNLNSKNGFPIFGTTIIANSVRKTENSKFESSETFQWTEEDEKDIRKLSQEKGVIDKIISSIAPSIYGHKDIKTAVALSLFGGVSKDIQKKHSIRGDINVLLLGDPGVAKSQILKYVEKTAHRAIFTTGQGASAVGLTASVKKDSITKEWTLEGGALVLADRGVCLIDEFDKMNDSDRTSIHEAMEQQSISISKAGIVTTLKARCAVIAAANPIGGRYNATLPLSQNVNLTEPILSRFDILCVVRDQVDPIIDERLANFVITSHMRSHPTKIPEEDKEEEDKDNDDEMSGGDGVESSPIKAKQTKSERAKTSKEKIDQLNKEKEKEISPISQELLVKYIHYARTKIHPKLNQMDMDKVSKVYSDLRRESITTGSFPITVRHLESIIRTAESFAKMRLSEYVSTYDLDRAIKVAVESFVGAQKISVRRQLQRSFMKYTLPNRK
ncbi:hypothetical protein PACTADRAFT_1419 [Pachysolen tannophilus NRRL Y-2460]|uniref:DNA replication licensing factor MCM2 n=1 Tax=Pachysolen tannophilus NRRL Y-2460 TaxID=669874 RepID=A0A1E4TYI7_PACTA|nr:hypothetical protein PACTADRAFT_1419 [Pachysolen tannophilus NRRL Y-2460]